MNPQPMEVIMDPERKAADLKRKIDVLETSQSSYLGGGIITVLGLLKELIDLVGEVIEGANKKS